MDGRIGELAPAKVTITAVKGEVFDITAADVNDAHFKATIVPIGEDGKPAATAPKPQAGTVASGSKAYEMTVTVASDLPAGRTSAVLTLRTTHPKAPDLTVRLYANARGDIEVQPERVTLRLGASAPEMAKVQHIALRRSTPTGPQFKVLSATGSVPGLEATVKTVTEGQDYDIEVTYTGPPPTQPMTERITIVTDNAKQPSIDVTVYAMTEPAASGGQPPGMQVCRMSTRPRGRRPRRLPSLHRRLLRRRRHRRKRQAGRRPCGRGTAWCMMMATHAGWQSSGDIRHDDCATLAPCRPPPSRRCHLRARVVGPRLRRGRVARRASRHHRLVILVLDIIAIVQVVQSGLSMPKKVLWILVILLLPLLGMILCTCSDGGNLVLRNFPPSCEEVEQDAACRRPCPLRPREDYSYLSASMGSSRDALSAGQKPKAIPTSAENRKASAMARGSTTTGQPASRPTSHWMRRPRPMPIEPPNAASTTASTRNWAWMSPPFAPIAMRTPISRVSPSPTPA